MTFPESGKINGSPSSYPVSLTATPQKKSLEVVKHDQGAPDNSPLDSALISQPDIREKAPEKKDRSPERRETAPDPLALAVERCNREDGRSRVEMTPTGALIMLESPFAGTPAALQTEKNPENPPSEPQNTSGSKMSITILHTNDIHGFLTNKEGEGSFSEIAQKAKEINIERENVLFLDAGDNSEGTHIANDTTGKSMVEALDVLDSELMAQDRDAGKEGKTHKLISTVGNHEAMYGYAKLRENIENSKHPVVVCNLFDKNDKPLKNTKPCEFVNFKDSNGNEVKAAIVGVTTEKLSEDKALKVRDPVQAVKDASRQAKEAGADMVIVLSHCGLEKNQEGGMKTDRDIAEGCPDVDVIVGGHSHDKIGDPVKVGNAIIVQAGCNAQYLGQLDLMIDTKIKKILPEGTKHTLIPIDKSMPYDPNIEAIARKYENARKEEEYNKKVGYLEESLQPPRINSGEESKLGNAFADKIRKTGNADIAIFNKGSLRTKFDKGDVTQRQCDNVFRYKDKIVTIKMKGRDVKELIEKSFTDNPHGGVYCVSGMKIEYDPMAPKGQKVKKIQIERKDTDGTTSFEDINLDREYTLATLTYVANLQNLKGKEHGTAKEAFDRMMKETLTNKNVFNVSTQRIRDLSLDRPEMNERIGKTIHPLISPIEREETNLGNFMADAVTWQHKHNLHNPPCEHKTLFLAKRKLPPFSQKNFLWKET